MARKRSSNAELTEEKILEDLEQYRWTGYQEAPRYSTGILMLDSATWGGWPIGTYSTIFGNSRTGKSTTCMVSCAAAQQQSPRPVAWIDLEQKTELSQLKMAGVDIREKRLFYSRPENGEQALDMLTAIVRSNAFSLVVFDSIAATEPLPELEASAGDTTMALQAKMLGTFFRRTTPALGRTQTAVLFTNQLRVSFGGYGSGEIEPGGRAVEFYPFLKIRTLSQDAKDREVRLENGLMIPTRSKYNGKVYKNSGGPPDRPYHWWYNYEGDTGTDVSMDIIETGLLYGIFTTPEGNVHAGNGTGVFQWKEITLGGGGKKAVAERLDNDPELAARIASDIQSCIARERHRSLRLLDGTGENHDP